MATVPFRMQPPDESGSLAEALWTVALATASAHEVRFASGCEGLTRQFVRSGAGVLKRQGKAEEYEAISQAVHHTVRYVELMVTDALTGGTPGELHENNFGVAQSRFCPCFPFC